MMATAATSNEWRRQSQRQWHADCMSPKTVRSFHIHLCGKTRGIILLFDFFFFMSAVSLHMHITPVE